MQLLLLIGLGISAVVAIDWLQAAVPTGRWAAVTCDKHCQHIAAADDRYFNGDGRGIYVSNDYGSSWQRTSAPVAYYHAITSDETGRYIVAASAGSGNIHLSTDFGTSWTQTSVPTMPWEIVTCDGKCQYIAASFGRGAPYLSSNYGASWTTVESLNNLGDFGTVTIDNSGQFMASCTVDKIYISSNFGVTWTQASAPSVQYSALIGSGKFLAAISVSKNMYTSRDYGSTWTVTSFPLTAWNSIDCDNSGMFWVAASTNGIYFSGDYGSTWRQTSAFQGSWRSITVDYYGGRVVAGMDNGYAGANSYIYTTNLSCLSGQYFDVNNMLCSLCPAGKYSSFNTSKIACSDCEQGKYSPIGASSCSPYTNGTLFPTLKSACHKGIVGSAPVQWNNVYYSVTNSPSS